MACCRSAAASYYMWELPIHEYERVANMRRSSHGKLYVLFSSLRDDQVDHDCQRVRPTCLNWDILDPKEFIAAYLQLGEIAKKCCDDFRKLLESTLDHRTALLASKKVAHRWREQATKANKDKGAKEVDDKVSEDDEAFEEREADAADDALIEEAVPLVLDLMNGKDFHEVPLRAVNVRAAEIYEDEMDEERMRAGRHVDSVSSWLSSLDGREKSHSFD